MQQHIFIHLTLLDCQNFISFFGETVSYICALEFVNSCEFLFDVFLLSPKNLFFFHFKSFSVLQRVPCNIPTNVQIRIYKTYYIFFGENISVSSFIFSEVRKSTAHNIQHTPINIEILISNLCVLFYIKSINTHLIVGGIHKQIFFWITINKTVVCKYIRDT